MTRQKVTTTEGCFLQGGQGLVLTWEPLRDEKQPARLNVRECGSRVLEVVSSAAAQSRRGRGL